MSCIIVLSRIFNDANLEGFLTDRLVQHSRNVARVVMQREDGDDDDEIH